MSTVPYVIEKDEKGNERGYDLYSRLMKDRIIFIKEAFTDEMASTIIAQLLFLESLDNEADIYMYINSPGGHITAAFAIFDVMQYIKPDIVTVGIGHCMSAGSFILAAGTKGKRYALPNTQIMIHELSGGLEGKFNEMLNRLEHTKKIHDRLANYYKELTGQRLDKVKKDMERDYYMSPEEAKDYGLIDEIHYKRDK